LHQNYFQNRNFTNKSIFMSQDKQVGSLETTIQKTVATVQFGHPASNSFPRHLLDRLTAELNYLSANPEVSVIVLQSEGAQVFCSGASFDELLEVKNIEQGTEFFSGFANLINAMRTCSKVIIGRVQGKTVGGGVGIIAACDYAFGTPESAVGKIAMSEMTLAAHEWKTAEWALQKGLFSAVYSAKELDSAVAFFAKKLSTYNPEALSEIKKIIWEGTEDWESLLLERAKITGRLVLSDFAKNALMQFKK